MIKNNKIEPIFYYHSDHLGSAAYLTDENGQVAQTLNYLPYGEDWVDIQHNLDPSLIQYRFNGKEKDYESGFHYYGARYYWSELLTSWLSVDPMMDKYPSISPYVYCAWNPVKLVDPDGNKVRFAPGTSEEFKKQFAETIKYMNSKGTGGIFAEIESRSETIYVTDIKNKKVSCFNSKDNTIYWNPTMGGVTDEGVTLSPATILNHEADHALQHVKNPAQWKQDLNTSDPDYDNLEEKRVITGSEQETARKHGEIKGNEVTRKNHNGSKYETISPTSTIGKKEIKIEG